jgi:hypothetical protein
MHIPCTAKSSASKKYDIYAKTNDIKSHDDSKKIWNTFQARRRRRQRGGASIFILSFVIVICCNAHVIAMLEFLIRGFLYGDVINSSFMHM